MMINKTYPISIIVAFSLHSLKGSWLSR
jgi:hypothetical protein